MSKKDRWKITAIRISVNPLQKEEDRTFARGYEEDYEQIKAGMLLRE